MDESFAAERFLDDFTEETRETPVDPGSQLGRAMAEAREAGIMEPGEFDEGSIRGTPVPD